MRLDPRPPPPRFRDHLDRRRKAAERAWRPYPVARGSGRAAPRAESAALARVAALLPVPRRPRGRGRLGVEDRPRVRRRLRALAARVDRPRLAGPAHADAGDGRAPSPTPGGSTKPSPRSGSPTSPSSRARRSRAPATSSTWSGRARRRTCCSASSSRDPASTRPRVDRAAPAPRGARARAAVPARAGRLGARLPGGGAALVRTRLRARFLAATATRARCAGAATSPRTSRATRTPRWPRSALPCWPAPGSAPMWRCCWPGLAPTRRRARCCFPARGSRAAAPAPDRTSDTIARWADFGAPLPGCDPAVRRLERDVRPPEYAESFARHARRLLLAEGDFRSRPGGRRSAPARR